MNVGALTLADGLAAQGFSTNLRLDKGRLDFDDVAMRLAGAAASGRATLRRSGEIATLAGALSVEPAARSTALAFPAGSAPDSSSLRPAEASPR